MLADVTNLAKGARGFHLADGATRFLEPGSSARLDLGDHPSHRAWQATGEVVIAEVRQEVVAEAAPQERPGGSRAVAKTVRQARAD